MGNVWQHSLYLIYDKLSHALVLNGSKKKKENMKICLVSDSGF